MIEEVQWARDNRDVLDTLRHKGQKADQLEADVAKYRRKLEDMGHLKKLLQVCENQLHFSLSLSLTHTPLSLSLHCSCL